MQKLLLSEIAAAIGADYHGGEVSVDYISTDSRDIRPGCLFVALEGERVDGHTFIPQVLAAGAAFAVAHKPVPEDAGRVLYVKDTFAVLMQVAALYRRRFAIPAVAVTGSVGKTTTKDFIAQVLSAKYNTLKSEGNNNNEIGLPRTVFKLDSCHEAAVFEMGMDHPGDLTKLAAIVRPDIGVITNIGVAHIEHMGSREAILAGKLEMTAGMPDGAPLILNADNDLLATVRQPRLRVVRYGIDSPADFIAREITEREDGCDFTVSHAGNTERVHIPTLGRHNVYNALAAFAVGVEMEVPAADILAALAAYTPSGMRQRVRRHGDFTVVEDCYNANPDSMRAALQTLHGMPCTGRRICVFGDMLELGDISDASHAEIGRLAAQSADALYTYGPQAALAAQAAREAGMAAVYAYADKPALAADLTAALQPGDIVWVKGSRGMQLEDVLEEIYRR